MHAEVSVRPTSGQDQLNTRPASATILAFPSRHAGDLEPAEALERITASLTSEQTRLLASEIGVLRSALSAKPSAPQPTSSPEGLRPRHARQCRSRRSDACSCEPSWEASVYSKIEKRKIRRTFPTRQEAISWRRRNLSLADNGQLRTPTRMTLTETGHAWVAMAGAGEILNRSGRQYKPSALRTIEQDLRLRLIPALGPHGMSEIAKADLQRLVGELLRKGLSASKIHNTITAAQVLWRDFDLITGTDNLLTFDPTRGLRLPAVTSYRDRIATPDEARRLIAALKEEDRALWATAMYAGVRCGELRALRVENIDLPMKRIRIRKGWDQYEGEIEPKSEKGKRSTVVIGLVHDLLIDHLQRTERTGTDLVFGRTATSPFNINTAHSRARRAWSVAREREDAENMIPEVERIRRIGLHECRHTAVSHMLDAGIAIDKVSKFMGHSSITVTIDLYGHLLPDGEAEAATLLDAYHGRRAQR